MSKCFAVIVIVAGFASGCATSVSTPEPAPPTPAPAFNQARLEPAKEFPNAEAAMQLDGSLTSLKATMDEGNLTDDEYARARAIAIKSFSNWALGARERGQSITAQSMHDEIGYLVQMNKEHRLSDEEFKQEKQVVVNYYLSAGQ